MGTRTRMTTPTGQLPEADVARERWTPGPRLPEEPTPPSRVRRLVPPAVAGLVIGLAISFGVTLFTNQANQDPALDQPGAPTEEIPGEEIPGEEIPGEDV